MDIDSLIQELKSNRIRITSTRKAILTLFTSGEHVSYSANEITEILRDKMDRATVYRGLTFLLNNNIIEKIRLIDDVDKYELAQHQNHHHHLVCTKCKKLLSVEDKTLETALQSVSNDAIKEHGFSVLDHVFEFYGICKNCTK